MVAASADVGRAACGVHSLEGRFAVPAPLELEEAVCPSDPVAAAAAKELFTEVARVAGTSAG
jgi:hypothetical protein